MAELELSDRAHFCYNTVALPHPCLGIRSLKLNLNGTYANLGMERSQSHIIWVKDVLQQMPTLQKLAIAIKYDQSSIPGGYAVMQNILNEQFWVTIPQLKALQVYDTSLRAGRRGRHDDFDFEYDDQMVLEWSSASCKMELVDLSSDKKATEVCNCCG